MTWRRASVFLSGGRPVFLETASGQVSAAVTDFGQQMIANLNETAALRMAADKLMGADQVNQGSADSLSVRVSDDISSGAGRHRADPPRIA